MRIQEHPILGTYQKGERVTFTFDGKILEGYAGEPIAMALKNAGVMIHRYTKKQHTVIRRKNIGQEESFVPLAVVQIALW